MQPSLKQVFLPLGISLAAVGIIFGLMIDRWFFVLSVAGLAFVLIASFKK